jgi:uncharacterized protein
VEAATIKVLYNGKNISADISNSLLSLTYTDKTQGESDELDIALEDSSKLWQFDWFPDKGATITAYINDGNGSTLNCGSFQLDEIEQAGSIDGDFITFKCIAAGITKGVRTKNNSAHQQKTLREIANTIAAKHGFKVEGNIANITLGYATQHQETDLQFLKRLALEFGYVFSLRDNTIFFSSIYDLEERKGVLVLKRQDLISYSITDKTANTYKHARVKHHSPALRKTIEYKRTETNNVNHDVKSDTLELLGRVENEGQAELKSKAALHKKNSHQQEGSFSIPGNVLVVAGNNVELTGLGRLSGFYHVVSSEHAVTKDGGYQTGGTIKRLGLATQSKQKPS